MRLGGKSQVIALQREVDGVDDRERRHDDHHEHRRGAEQPAQPALGARSLRQLLAVLALGPRGLTSGDYVGSRCRHGISPFDWSASLICPTSACSVPGGLMPAGGDTLCEMTMETFWYAGVFGRTLAVLSAARMSAWNGYAGNIAGSLYRLSSVGGKPPSTAALSWFCLSRRHSAAWKARSGCGEYLLIARSIPPMVTCAGVFALTRGYRARLKCLNSCGLSAFIDG